VEYLIVALQDVQNENIINSIDIKPIRLAFKDLLLICGGYEEKQNRCIKMKAWNENKMGSDVVKEFIGTYNSTHNTTFNTMKDVKIEKKVYVQAGGDPRGGDRYYISGILLEIK
jgi:hypothetical protein